MKRFYRLSTGGFFIRPILIIALCLIHFIPMAFSQSANALYLNDGDRIIGYIMALDSAGDVRIQTTEGQMLSFPISDVDHINWAYQIKDPGRGAIYRLGDKFYWKYNKSELSDRDFERYFDDDLYHTYITASNQLNIGGGCWVYSIGCLVTAVLMFDFDSGRQPTSFYVYAAGANVLACLGCIFTGIGKRRLDWVERTFNSQYAASNEVSYSSGILNSIKLNPSIMMTAQRDLAFGATLSLSF